MPNQSTRIRRREAKLPTNVQTVKCSNGETFRMSRLGSKPCSTQFIVVGNSPDVTLSWIGALLGCEKGFRLYPQETYTVWIFNTKEDASRGVNRFRQRGTAELPVYVPKSMRTSFMYLLEVVDPPPALLKLLSL